MPSDTIRMTRETEKRIRRNVVMHRSISSDAARLLLLEIDWLRDARQKDAAQLLRAYGLTPEEINAE